MAKHTNAKRDQAGRVLNEHFLRAGESRPGPDFSQQTSYMSGSYHGRVTECFWWPPYPAGSRARHAKFAQIWQQKFGFFFEVPQFLNNLRGRAYETGLDSCAVDNSPHHPNTAGTVYRKHPPPGGGNQRQTAPIFLSPAAGQQQRRRSR